jgi:hypothetical protein
VKHEDVYLKGYASMGELTLGLIEYFTFFNGERPHQSLGYRTPNAVYEAARGGRGGDRRSIWRRAGSFLGSVTRRWETSPRRTGAAPNRCV